MADKATKHLCLAFASRTSKKRNTITISMSVKDVIITGLISMDYQNVFEILLKKARCPDITPDMRIITKQGIYIVYSKFKIKS